MEGNVGSNHNASKETVGLLKNNSNIEECKQEKGNMEGNNYSDHNPVKNDKLNADKMNQYQKDKADGELNQMTAEELSKYYKNLRLDDKSISEAERNALNQKVCTISGTWKDMYTVYFYNKLWHYICHICGKDMSPWVTFCAHISGKRHNLTYKSTEFPIKSEKGFKVHLVQGSKGIFLRDSLEEEDITTEDPVFCKQTTDFKRPLVGLEYLIEIKHPETHRPTDLACLLCEEKGNFKSGLTHLTNHRHYWNFLAKFFPSAEERLSTLYSKGEINENQRDGLLNHLIARIEYTYGRLKPLLVSDTKIDGLQWIIFDLIEWQFKHMREVPEQDFIDCVNVDHLNNGVCPVGWLRRKNNIACGRTEEHKTLPNNSSFFNSFENEQILDLTYKKLQEKIDQESKKLETNVHENNELIKKCTSTTRGINWQFPGKVFRNPECSLRLEQLTNVTQIRKKQDDKASAAVVIKEPILHVTLGDKNTQTITGSFSQFVNTDQRITQVSAPIKLEKQENSVKNKDKNTENITGSFSQFVNSDQRITQVSAPIKLEKQDNSVKNKDKNTENITGSFSQFVNSDQRITQVSAPPKLEEQENTVRNKGSKWIFLRPGDNVKLDIATQWPIFDRYTANFDKPLVGLEYLIEIKHSEINRPTELACLLCEEKGDFESVFAHLTTIKHYGKFLAKFFPSAEKKLSFIHSTGGINKEERDRLIQHLVARIEYIYGRAKPLMVSSTKFDGMNWVIFYTVERQCRHMRELRDRDFMDCVDVNHLNKNVCPVGWLKRKHDLAKKEAIRVDLPSNSSFFNSFENEPILDLPYKKLQEKIDQESRKFKTNVHEKNESTKKWISEISCNNGKFLGSLFQNQECLMKLEQLTNVPEIREIKVEKPSDTVIIKQPNLAETPKDKNTQNITRCDSQGVNPTQRITQVATPPKPEKQKNTTGNKDKNIQNISVLISEVVQPTQRITQVSDPPKPEKQKNTTLIKADGYTVSVSRLDPFLDYRNPKPLSCFKGVKRYVEVKTEDENSSITFTIPTKVISQPPKRSRTCRIWNRDSQTDSTACFFKKLKIDDQAKGLKKHPITFKTSLLSVDKPEAVLPSSSSSLSTKLVKEIMPTYPGKSTALFSELAMKNKDSQKDYHLNKSQTNPAKRSSYEQQKNCVKNPSLYGDKSTDAQTIVERLPAVRSQTSPPNVIRNATTQKRSDGEVRRLELPQLINKTFSRSQALNTSKRSYEAHNDDPQDLIKQPKPLSDDSFIKKYIKHYETKSTNSNNQANIQDDNNSLRQHSVNVPTRSFKESFVQNVPNCSINNDMIGVLRLLSVLETDLGSLGTEIVDLLSEAAQLEILSKGGSNILITREEILLETVKEKLIALLEVGLLDHSKSVLASSLVNKIQSLISNHENKMPKKFLYSENPSSSNVGLSSRSGVKLCDVPEYIKQHSSVLNISYKEEDRISAGICSHLQFRNIFEINEDKLVLLINDYVRKEDFLGESSLNIKHCDYDQNTSDSPMFYRRSNNFNQLSTPRNNSAEDISEWRRRTTSDYTR